MRNNAERGMRNAELRTKFALSREKQAEDALLALGTPHSALRTPHSVDLHIDELVLYGFSPADRHRIAEGVERELGRLLEQQGLSAPTRGDIEVEQLDGGSFRMLSGGKAATTASQIATAVFGAAASVMAPAKLPAAGPAPSGDTRP